MQEDPIANKSPFFVVGCARSGTTLLRDLLRSHSRIFIHQESHFVPWLYATYGDPGSDREAEHLGREILEALARRSYPTGTLTPADFTHCRTYREAAELPFRRACQAAGKCRWADKTPHYVEYIPEILEIFPEARFVHIIRDGRDVARSLLLRNFGENTIYTAAAIWRHRIERGRAARTRFGPQVIHEIRYEELVQEPEKVLTEVLHFLGELFEPAVLQRTALPKRKRSRWLGDKLRMPPTEMAINPQRALRWQKEMSTSDQTIFESVAAKTLDDLGYQVRGLARQLRPYERAWWRLEDLGRRLWLRIRWAELGPNWVKLNLMRLKAKSRGLR